MKKSHWSDKYSDDEIVAGLAHQWSKTPRPLVRNQMKDLMSRITNHPAWNMLEEECSQLRLMIRSQLGDDIASTWI